MRHLSPEELENPVWTKLITKYDDTLIDKLGPSTSRSNFDLNELTPQYQQYEPNFDGLEGSPDNPDPADIIPAAPPETIDPTPEIGDTYLGANVMLPRGGKLARGHVHKRKRDHDDNVIGNANANLILDTR